MAAWEAMGNRPRRCGYNGKPPTGTSDPVGTGVAICLRATRSRRRYRVCLPAAAARCWSPGRAGNKHCMGTCLHAYERARPAAFHALHRMQEEIRRGECCVRRRTRDKKQRTGIFPPGPDSASEAQAQSKPGGPVLRDGDRDRDGDASNPSSSFCRASRCVTTTPGNEKLEVGGPGESILAARNASPARAQAV